MLVRNTYLWFSEVRHGGVMYSTSDWGVRIAVSGLWDKNHVRLSLKYWDMKCNFCDRNVIRAIATKSKPIFHRLHNGIRFFFFFFVCTHSHPIIGIVILSPLVVRMVWISETIGANLLLVDKSHPSRLKSSSSINAIIRKLKFFSRSSM